VELCGHIAISLVMLRSSDTLVGVSSQFPTFIAWLPSAAYMKLDERSGPGKQNITQDCQVGAVFVNPTESSKSSPTSQGFAACPPAAAAGQWPCAAIANTSSGAAVKLRLTFSAQHSQYPEACNGLCLDDDGEEGVKLAPCAKAAVWHVRE